MSDDRRRSVLSHTPIPTDLMGLTRAVTRIEERVVSIQKDLLPPVAAASSQARDGVIKLEGYSQDLTRRIRTLENAPPPVLTHECVEDQKLEEHAKAITSQEKELAGLSKWRTWLAAIMLPLVLAAAGAAAKSIADSASLHTVVDSHSKTIDHLVKARERDRDAIIREVQAVSTKVRQVATEVREEDGPSVKEVRSRMSSRQKRRLKALMREVGINDR